MSITWRIGKQIVVYLYSEILPRNPAIKRKKTFDMHAILCMNLKSIILSESSQSQKAAHHTIIFYLYDILAKAKLWEQESNQWLPGAGRGIGDSPQREMKEFGIMKTFHYLACGSNHTTMSIYSNLKNYAQKGDFCYK